MSEGKPLSRCATAPLSGEPKASGETPIGLRPLPQKREARAVGRWPTVIACDFDGTLCDEAWPEIGAPHWPIIHELIRRQCEGARIILWTCREGELLENAVMWCLNHGIKFDAINSNVAERIEQYGDDPRKVSADEYWDDRSVLVSGGNSLLRAEPECYWMQTWEEATLTCAGQKGKSRFGVWIRGLWKRIVPKGQAPRQTPPSPPRTAATPPLAGEANAAMVRNDRESGRP